MGILIWWKRDIYGLYVMIDWIPETLEDVNEAETDGDAEPETDDSSEKEYVNIYYNRQ